MMKESQKKEDSFKNNEEKILEFWEKNNVFEKSISQRKKGKLYSFYDGPPFATGLPHYGHILGSVIKDVIPRYFAMKGFRVPRKWGWDCHGLPIENIIEKKFNINSKKEIESLGIDKFNAAAREAVLTYDKEWEKTIRRAGRFVDFKDSYKTMDNSYMETVWWVFGEMAKKGLIYEDTRISLYCPRCATPLSNFEIAMDNSYKEITESAVAIKLNLFDEKNTSLLAWTTTPWTLIGNVAAAINSELVYVKVKIKNSSGAEAEEEYFILAKSRLEYLNGFDYEIVKEFKGKELAGKKYQKLYELGEAAKEKNGSPRFLPRGKAGAGEAGWYVLEGDFVSENEGTGVVHMALYGDDDYKMAKKHNLPFISHIGEDGRLIAGPKEWLGTWYKDLDAKVIEDLKKRNLLFKTENHLHSYPFCYRCETPLYYALQPAWFVNIGKVRKNMLEANKKINWKPEHLKNGRFKNGIITAPDWNLSRSRYFGAPLPIWKCGKCGNYKFVSSIEELKNLSQDGKNNFYIMRHGEAEHNVKNVTNGLITNNYYSLTKKGLKQAHESALKFKRKGVKVDLIISSDFLRAEQTAEIAKNILGAPKIIYDERLREISTGIFEGENVSLYHKYFASLLEKFYKNPPEGESLMDLKKKMTAFLADISSKYQNKNILIVSHEYPLWILSSAALGFSNEETAVWKNKMKKDFVGLAEIKKLKYFKLPLNGNGDMDLHRPYIDEIKLKCEKCGGEMDRIKDVFDCWFESGSMPYASVHYPFQNKKQFKESFPADFIAEYIAQTRGWFYTLHVISTALFNKPAFKNVVTTGTILAENGEKMSKSKNNFPDPWIIFDKYGADALRYYLMASPVMLTAENINFSEDVIKEVKNKVISTLANTLNFFLLYGSKKIKPTFDLKKITLLDKWILSRLESLIKEMTEDLDDYEITRAARPCAGFIDDLSNWYIRRSRRRFQRPENKNELKTASAILSYVLTRTAKAISVFTPFIAEEIYQKTRVFDKEKKVSVHLCDYPKYEKKFIDKKLEEKMNLARNIVSLALQARNNAGIKVRQPIALLKLQNFRDAITTESVIASRKHANKLQAEILDLIKEEVNVKEIIFDKNMEEKIWLDTKITSELKEEGFLRDVIRVLQDLRKKMRFTPKDTPTLLVDAKDYGEKFVLKYKEYIKQEARFSKIEFRNFSSREEKFLAKIRDRDIEIRFSLIL